MRGTYYVDEAGDDDYYDEDTELWVTGTTLLNTQYNRGVTPDYITYARIKIDTTNIPESHKILSAELNIYCHSYSAVRGVTTVFDVENDDGFIKQEPYLSADWYRIVIPNDKIDCVKKGEKSIFYISVPMPGSGQTRELNIRAFEYGGSNEFRAYLDVNHAPISPFPMFKRS